MLRQCDIVFWGPRQGTKRSPEWLQAAVGTAATRRTSLVRTMQLANEDIVHVHVFAMYMLGAVKEHLLENIGSRRFPGSHWCFSH